MATDRLPTWDEQQQTYRRAKALFDERYTAWEANGKVGNPPPRPVPPHIPGRTT